ncbi:hypothetical protein AMAG_03209 [Allomyces macrogynus ATCC 38327]|uniref:glutathione gamma-glutamylcysteinyltransferase n=1 Tax=Allomyces macrogynus (strain ATCC 38327) TaxID=578462 RepID=A0A0L0S4S5_ALLM3|nr:hypothetical protein AMAG_03209 [Allomyces macrogynus ATCC 38327]|eukprot:KNE57502.1 hypothetical protein AMAG_03209 [Allomyces macrogynus ATCC 38327]
MPTSAVSAGPEPSTKWNHASSSPQPPSATGPSSPVTTAPSPPVSPPPPVAAPALASFYKRALPPTCIDFASPVGKDLFRCALNEGNVEGYFRLASQFTTQSEPALCGPSTLCMVLNALGVDPQRQWKGVWRWYDDTMLDCCRPMEEIKRTGITLGEFGCLAMCNGLSAKVYRGDRVTKAKFLRDIQRTSATEDEVLCVSFSRSVLSQTGDGHFSPVAGYCRETNMVLILDVARFKYPPYWVSVDLLWDALLPCDSVTQKPRGYVVLSRNPAAQSLPKLSLTTSTIALLVSQLCVEFPRRILADPGIDTHRIDEVVAKLMACIPDEMANVVLERDVHDPPSAASSPRLEARAGPGLDGTLDGHSTPNHEASDIVPPLPRDRTSTGGRLREAYAFQLAQLVHLLHEHPLCQVVMQAMRTGTSSRHRSQSVLQMITAIPAAPAPPATHHSRCRFCSPVASAHSSQEDLFAAQPEYSDPKTPAFLTLLLLAFTPAELFPPEWKAARPDLSAKVAELWDVEHAPLLVRHEVAQLRAQMRALHSVWCEERAAAAAAAAAATVGTDTHAPCDVCVPCVAGMAGSVFADPSMARSRSSVLSTALSVGDTQTG